MFPQVARASVLDSLRFTLCHLLPVGLQGPFRKRPFWVGLFARLHPDPLGRRFVARLRRKYGTPFVDLGLFRRRTRLVLCPEAARAVLERSPDAYADARAKRAGMKLFQPDAATVSRPPAWAVRRRFNDTVLSAGTSGPLGDHFAALARAEVVAWRAGNPRRLAWADLEALFRRLTARVVLGAADDGALLGALLGALDRLTSAANGLLFRCAPPAARAALEAGLRARFQNPDPNSLVGVAARLLGDATAFPPGAVRAEGQVPHWLFAMKDTLAANAALALALLLAHPEVRQRALADLPAGRAPTAAELDRAELLGGCVQEGMRLWPTVPMLLREATCGGVLGDVHGPGLQVLVWTAAGARDAALVPRPDHFDPGRWAAGGPAGGPFTHLSAGRQDCSGRALALLLAKAVLAALFDTGPLAARAPRLPAGGPQPEALDWFRFAADV